MLTHRLLLALAFLGFAVGAVLGFGWFARRPVLVAAAAYVLRERQRK